MAVGAGRAGLGISCFLRKLLWQHTRGSALIGWVQDDDWYLAEQISKFDPGPVVQRLPKDEAVRNAYGRAVSPAGF